MDQLLTCNTCVVDICPVGAVQILDGERILFADDPCVVPGYSQIVDVDVAAFSPADSGDAALEG
jgi:hypothetical protein